MKILTEELNISSDIDETIKNIEAMKILTEELIPKTQDVKVDEIGDMVDSEILILVLICPIGGDITSNIEDTIKNIEAMTILTDELIPKTEMLK